MHDILHDFWIKDNPRRVFSAFVDRPGLDHWWTKSSEGKAELGCIYRLYFGEGYDWKGLVTRCIEGAEFEWEIQANDEDWNGSRVGFDLSTEGEYTKVRFYHKGWPHQNDHYRRSSYCWAMYLRSLKRYVEENETVPYEVRTSV